METYCVEIMDSPLLEENNSITFDSVSKKELENIINVSVKNKKYVLVCPEINKKKAK